MADDELAPSPWINLDAIKAEATEITNRDLERAKRFSTGSGYADNTETVHGLIEVQVTYVLPNGRVTYTFSGDISAAHRIEWDEAAQYGRVADVGVRLAGVHRVHRSGEATRQIYPF